MRLPFQRAVRGRDSAESRRALLPSPAGRKGYLVLALVLLALIPGCGDDEDSPPALTGYHVPWPQRFVVGFPDALIRGTVSFADPDGDVVILHTAWQDCGAGEVKKLDTLLEDLQGSRTGEIPFVVEINTYCPIGDYAVQLSVTDRQGQGSNVLSVPYEIYAPSGETE